MLVLLVPLSWLLRRWALRRGELAKVGGPVAYVWGGVRLRVVLCEFWSYRRWELCWLESRGVGGQSVGWVVMVVRVSLHGRHGRWRVHEGAEGILRASMLLL